MADHQNGGFTDIHGGGAQAYQRSLGHGCGVFKSRDLGDISDLHSHMVQHTGMKGLGLIIYVAALLTGMERRNQVDQLPLHILDRCSQVAHRFRFQSQHGPDVGCLNGDIVAQIDFVVLTVLFNHKINDVSGMGAVSRKAHTAGQKDEPSLLTGDVDAAGPPLSAGEVALTVGAEAAHIAERRVEGLVGLH